MTHKHHIMPRHLGGTNEPENLVEVTVEEHAEIHRCLWIYGGRWQDELAWRGLTGQIGKEEVQKFICAQTGKSNKGKQWCLGKKRSATTKEKIRQAKVGKRLTADHKRKISEAQMGHSRGGWKLSEETRQRMSNRMRGNTYGILGAAARWGKTNE